MVCRKIRVALGLMCCVLVINAYAQGAWRWRDDQGVWTVWQNNEIALLNTRRGDEIAQKSPPVSQAILVKRLPHLQIWQLPQVPQSKAGLPVTRPWSPVFREFAADQGRRMVAVGGVIVRFKLATSHDKMQEWLQAGQWAQSTRISRYTWFIPTEPGWPALELATRLNTETGTQSVLHSASPNWWIEVHRK